VEPLLLVGLPMGTRPGAGDPRELVRIAGALEDAGAGGVVVSDHVLIGPRTDLYPWGDFPFPPEAPWLEPLTVLTAIAAVTERLVLTTGVLIVPLRPAPLLAKTVATLDVLSRGRFVLGAGTGWQAEELEAQGLDPAARGRLLTDTIAACRALWRDAPATFSSATVSFEHVWSEPRPTRPGGPPVLFSGTLTARNVRRIVELGDGWIPIMGATIDDVAAGTARLRAALADAGRDPGELRVRVPLPVVRGDLAATLAGAGDATAAGATEVSVPWGAIGDDRLPELAALLANRG
jgi:probable F420-dependent oxidoreductase